MIQPSDTARRLSGLVGCRTRGDGLFEFRVRHDAATIEAVYGPTTRAEQSTPPRTQRKILLRLFVHFYGTKVVLLLHGYDKGGNDSPRQQNKETAQPASV